MLGLWGYNENEEQVKGDELEELDASESKEASGASDNVNNRVAGMSLKHIFEDHKDAVTAITCFSVDGNHWMVWVKMSNALVDKWMG